jgi:hypothetical protein
MQLSNTNLLPPLMQRQGRLSIYGSIIEQTYFHPDPRHRLIGLRTAAIHHRLQKTQ